MQVILTFRDADGTQYIANARGGFFKAPWDSFARKCDMLHTTHDRREARRYTYEQAVRALRMLRKRNPPSGDYGLYGLRIAAA